MADIITEREIGGERRRVLILTNYYRASQTHDSGRGTEIRNMRWDDYCAAEVTRGGARGGHIAVLYHKTRPNVLALGRILA